MSKRGIMMGLPRWEWEAVRAGRRMAQRGVAVALFQVEAEKRARAYMRRALKRQGVTEAEAVRRALHYRFSCSFAAHLEALSLAQQTQNIVLEAEVMCYVATAFK